MKKNAENKGFSLIELIVLIAMITVLTGMLVPQFVKYASEKRQTACRANREALLNIYEKAVYDGQLGVSSSDLHLLLTADASLNVEYANQATDYIKCPADDGATYSAYSDGNKVYITCSCHPDDVCSLSMESWTDIADDMGGEPTDLYAVPADLPEPETPGPVDAPEEPPVDTTETCNTGTWPYPMDTEGRIDARWAAAGGAQPGKTVNISAPLHFVDKSGIEIVIVKGNTNSTMYTVSYENASSPLGKGGAALPYVIAASGKKYDANNLPDKQVEEGEPIYEYHPAYDEEVVTQNWVQGSTYVWPKGFVSYIHHKAENVKIGNKPGKTIYRINYGDMLTLNGVTYIYANNSGGNSYVELPKEGEIALATSYNDWYVVPALSN